MESLVIRAAKVRVREGFVGYIYGFADGLGLFANMLGKLPCLVGVVLELEIAVGFLDVGVCGIGRESQSVVEGRHGLVLKLML